MFDIDKTFGLLNPARNDVFAKARFESHLRASLDSRAVVKESVHCARTKTVGYAITPSTDLGPIQNEMHYGKLSDLFAYVRAKGYEVLVGGAVDLSLPCNFVSVTFGEEPR